jgi:transcriptional regulator with XRE-family HTH domain
MKARKKLVAFGDYLRGLRERSSTGTQQQIAERITRLGCPVSQGLIAQYEGGKLSDPDPRILHLLAATYGEDYFRMIDQLVKEKYDPDGRWSKEGLTVERRILRDAALRRFDKIGGISNDTTENSDVVRQLERLQLRAKGRLVDEREVLDVEGVLLWLDYLPNLREVWLAIPNFLDPEDPTVRAHVSRNMRDRGVMYVYFVRPADASQNGRLGRLKKKLSAEAGIDNIDNVMKVVPLAEEQLVWLAVTDYVIANPLENPKAFQYFRKDEKPDIAIRIEDQSLKQMVDQLYPLLAKLVDEANRKATTHGLSLYLPSASA